MYKAILSTTVCPLDGAYTVRTLKKEEVANLKLEGVPHYIGHPDTRAIVEKLGAVPAESRLFTGLQVGEQAICFPIQQGKSTRAELGFATPHQGVTVDDLSVRIVTRWE